jgi:hypothetical protein
MRKGPWNPRCGRYNRDRQSNTAILLALVSCSTNLSEGISFHQINKDAAPFEGDQSRVLLCQRARQAAAEISCCFWRP